jgi:tripeptide aminopeptidase
MKFNIKHSALERFLRYVKIDTQSDPSSESVPSTEKQKNLGKLLVEELQAIGIKDAEMDDMGYIYATIPSNTDKDVPVICYCGHMDTSPDSCGKDVKPIIHKNYDGKDIVLPDDSSVIIKTSENPDLANQIGNDIVTASGTTLLGADNKAGIAEIMDLAEYLINTPEIKHGKIRILFTPDEEIGKDAHNVNIEKLGAKYAYTVDGEKAGALETETFSADMVTITINGVSAHPGFAKGKLENAAKIAGDLLASLPKDGWAPETTEAREGFVHPTDINGIAEKVSITFIIRDFQNSGLEAHEKRLKELLDNVMKNYPKSTAEFKVKEQYRNMKVVLDKHPDVVNNAVEAIKRTGLDIFTESIRGGTTGSQLSFKGLPTPNIYAGEHSFHSKTEWIAVQDMHKAVETLVHLAMVWEERA